MNIQFNQELANQAAKIYASKHLAVEGTVAELGFTKEECREIQEATALKLFQSPLKETIVSHCGNKPSRLSNSFDQWCDEYDYLLNQLEAEFEEAKSKGLVTIPEINESTVIAVEVNYKGEEDGEYLIYDLLKDTHSTFHSKYNYS